MATSSATSGGLSLRPLLDKVKLNGTNYLEWNRNPMIVFRIERKEHVLDQATPEVPATTATRAVKDAYYKHLNDATDVGCIMLG